MGVRSDVLPCKTSNLLAQGFVSLGLVNRQHQSKAEFGEGAGLPGLPGTPGLAETTAFADGPALAEALGTATEAPGRAAEPLTAADTAGKAVGRAGAVADGWGALAEGVCAAEAEGALRLGASLTT